MCHAKQEIPLKWKKNPYLFLDKRQRIKVVLEKQIPQIPCNWSRMNTYNEKLMGVAFNICIVFFVIYGSNRGLSNNFFRLKSYFGKFEFEPLV